jgi:hypothetical protein
MNPEEYQQVLAEQMSETDLQGKIRRLARLRGFSLIYHTRDSRRSDVGFPDLVMIKGRRLLFAELKKQKGSRTTPEQLEWLSALTYVGVETYLWKPSDLIDGTIDRILRGTP